MNGPHDQEDTYVAALRGQLGGDADRARIRLKLAAAGVGVSSAAALLPASAKGATLAGKLKLFALSKTFLAVAGLAVVGGSLFFASELRTGAAPDTVRPSAPMHAEPAPVQAAPLAQPAQASPAQPRPAKLRRVRPRAEPSPDTLAQENALVGAAVKALHAGDTVSARRLLDQHESRFPDGVLRAERERARKRLGTDGF
jgi:hypothetical protein